MWVRGGQFRQMDFKNALVVLDHKTAHGREDSWGPHIGTRVRKADLRSGERREGRRERGYCRMS